jgi:hypothetical protein
VAVPGWLTGVGPTSGYKVRSPMGPISVTSGKRQAVEVAGINRAAQAELGVGRGGI